MKVQNDSHVSLPSMTEAQEFVSALEALDLRRLDYQQLRELTISYFPYIPVTWGTFTPDLLFFRVRLTEKPRPFEQIADIGPPPSSLLTGLGRANRPFNPVFYASYSPRVALLEACQALGVAECAVAGYATVGVWKPVLQTQLNLVNLYSYPEARQKRLDLQHLDHFYQSLTKIQEFDFDRPAEESFQVASLIVDHIAGAFAKPCVRCNNEYMLSAVYGDRILCDDSEGFWDGINYPSVAMRYSIDNVVLRLSSFHDKVRLSDAFLVSYVYEPSKRLVFSQTLSKARVEDDLRLSWA